MGYRRWLGGGTPGVGRQYRRLNVALAAWFPAALGCRVVWVVAQVPLDYFFAYEPLDLIPDQDPRDLAWGFTVDPSFREFVQIFAVFRRSYTMANDKNLLLGIGHYSYEPKRCLLRWFRVLPCESRPNGRWMSSAWLRLRKALRPEGQPRTASAISRQKNSTFDVAKAAQVAAYFAACQGGNINVLKLVKLIYLADRECMDKYGFPITYDRIVSMPNGPVNSLTLNYINGLMPNSEEWDRVITDRAQHEVGIAKENLAREELDQVSESELDILRETWKRFGHLNGFELADYTHENCPEWTDPNGSSFPIDYADVFKALGKSEARAHELADDIQEEQRIDAVFQKYVDLPAG